MSIRSIGRPSNFAPAAAAPSAMPFISSRYSASKRRRNRALTSVRMSCQASLGALATAARRPGFDEVDDLGRQQPAVLIAALVGRALDVQDDPARLRIAVRRAVANDRRRIGSKAAGASQRLALGNATGRGQRSLGGNAASHGEPRPTTARRRQN